jgi:hypothetical protein
MGMPDASGVRAGFALRSLSEHEQPSSPAKPDGWRTVSDSQSAEIRNQPRLTNRTVRSDPTLGGRACRHDVLIGIRQTAQEPLPPRALGSGRRRSSAAAQFGPEPDDCCVAVAPVSSGPVVTIALEECDPGVESGCPRGRRSA